MHSGTLINIFSQNDEKIGFFHFFGTPQNQKLSFFGQKSQISCFGGSKNVTFLDQKLGHFWPFFGPPIFRFFQGVLDFVYTFEFSWYFWKKRGQKVWPKNDQKRVKKRDFWKGQKWEKLKKVTKSAKDPASLKTRFLRFFGRFLTKTLR